jgi:hypothetical protein
VHADWNIDAHFGWIIDTKIPHLPFEIRENGKPFCRGIVFALADVKKEGMA